MARYDRQWSWRGGPRDDVRGWGGRYGGEYGGWSDSWRAPRGAGFAGWGGGSSRQWGHPVPWGGYDRGLYGEGYPAYGGYPGGGRSGMYYGGREVEPRYDTAMRYDDMGRRGPDVGRRGGYDAGFGEEAYPRQPFLPPEAYQRNPELERPQRHTPGRWPDEGHDLAVGIDMDDHEIRQAVRQSLFQDNWLQADRIEVDVNGGVVTLTGEVGDYLEARYAWDDAWETAGVRGVVNQLTVRTDRERSPQGDPVPQTAGAQRAAKGSTPAAAKSGSAKSGSGGKSTPAA